MNNRQGELTPAVCLPSRLGVRGTTSQSFLFDSTTYILGSASLHCHPCSPFPNTLVWSEGSIPLELAESTRNRAPAGHRLAESNSMCVHAPSLVSRPQAHNQHGGSLLCPLRAGIFVSPLFKTRFASAICPSNLDVLSYSCQNAA